MKNKNTIILVAVILVMLLVMIFLADNKKRINWEPTYSNEGTNPYDTYITYREAKNIFDEVEVTRKPIYNRLENDWRLSDYDYEDSEDYENFAIENTDHWAYIFINQSFELDRLDLEHLLNFVGNGNEAFISAEEFSFLLLDTLNVKVNETLYSNDGDTTYILKDYPAEKYRMRNLMTKTKFLFDSTFVLPYEVLGRDGHDDAVFVRLSFGEGNIYLHALPTAFTNYYQANITTYDYAYRCLSYIPRNTRIIWDEYQSRGGEGEPSIFRTLFNDNRLLLSLWLALFGFLIFMLFRAKRVQRIIPVINKPVNSSVEFLETISNLYYRKKDFATIVEKRHAYFLDYVRRQYYLSTETVDEEFIQSLSAKSGMEKDELHEVFELYREMISSPTDISNTAFLRYNELLEIFYKNVRN